MAKSLLEMQADEEADAQAERARFEELADQYRQQSHLPPQGDQSWREREAERLATYDKGYTLPQNDQSWRDREAMLFAPAREENTADAMPEPVLRPAAAKSGHGGTILIFVLVMAIVLGIAALAYPEMLTAPYWRSTQTNAVTQPLNPPPEAVQPSAMPPAAAQQPLPLPAPDLKRIPAVPAPPVQEAPPPSVPVIDARPIPAPARKPAVSVRAPARDDRSGGGFYVKVPGPDGVMRDTFFPTDPQSPSRKPVQKEPAVPETGGFYAKVPGPDGTLELKRFPSTPPPR